MTTPAEETIKKQVQSLPPKVQRALASTDIQGPLKEIYEKHGLLLDKASALETETVLIAVGLESGEDFVDNIVKNVEVNEVEATAMAKEIDEKIFSQIRKGLQTDTPTDSDEEDENNIRQQIEQPTPTGSKIAPLHTPTPSVPESKPPTNLPTGKDVPTDTSAKDDTGQSIIESRLKEPMVNAFQKTEVGEKVKRSYPDGSDPYKEPVE